MKIIGEIQIKNYSEYEVNQKVMDHICILEVQHFPGLAFSGTSTDDKKTKDKEKDGKFNTWAKFHYELLCELIDFYKPNIVIGERFSLGTALVRNNEKDSSVKSWNELNKREMFENHDEFFEWLYNHELSERPELYFIGKRTIDKDSQDKEEIRNNNNVRDPLNHCNLVKDEEGCLWLGWYHPEAGRRGNEEWEEYVISNMAKFIKRNLP